MAPHRGIRTGVPAVRSAVAAVAVALMAGAAPAATACSCLVASTRAEAVELISQVPVVFTGTAVDTGGDVALIAVDGVYHGDVGDRIGLTARPVDDTCSAGMPVVGQGPLLFLAYPEVVPPDMALVAGAVRLRQGGLCDYSLGGLRDGTRIPLEELAVAAFGPPRPPSRQGPVAAPTDRATAPASDRGPMWLFGVGLALLAAVVAVLAALWRSAAGRGRRDSGRG